MLIKKLSIIFVLLMLSVLTACSTTNGDNAENSAVVEDRAADGSKDTEGYEGQTGAYNDSSMGEGSAVDVDGQTGGSDLLSVRTLYFEYDSTTINTQGQSVLNAHAEHLSLNPDKMLIIEGHTDEQGTREYNLALGERRARAIADFLSASGVAGEQLDVRSYGEENPAALGHNESAWQLNRRVELLY